MGPAVDSNIRPVVLVVDDELVVLNLVASVLERAGFHVLRTGNPNDALRIGADHPQPIHMLLVDVVMPGLSGPMLAEQFAQAHPESRCLFMAGLVDTIEVQNLIIRRGHPLLPKPFFPQALLGKVREVLSSAASNALAARA